jgi:bifunctional DNase/RNase
MNKIELEIVALSHSVTQSHNYAVVLGEINGSRRLPIVIGGFEAQAIAVAMENMTPNRPLTHDLFKNTLDTFSISLKEVLINNLQDGIFYAQLICEKEGEVFKIDSRTSDAIAMAVRYECPIFTLDFIMEEAGVVLEESESRSSRQRKKKVSDPSDLSTYTKKALNKLLEDVLAKEDYEQAAKIRDEINRRSADQS